MNKEARILVSKGQSALAAHNFDEAVAYFDDALEKDPHDNELIQLLADALSKKREASENVRYNFAEGRAAFAAKDYDQAIEYFRTALRLDPSNDEILRNLQLAVESQQVEGLIASGREALKERDYQTAAVYLEQALEIDPDNRIAKELLSKVQSALAGEGLFRFMKALISTSR